MDKVMQGNTAVLTHGTSAVILKHSSSSSLRKYPSLQGSPSLGGGGGGPIGGGGPVRGSWVVVGVVGSILSKTEPLVTMPPRARMARASADPVMFARTEPDDHWDAD